MFRVKNPQKTGLESANRLLTRTKVVSDLFTKALEEELDKSKAIGLHGGGFSEVCILKERLESLDGLVFFDGDTALHGKTWITGLPVINSPEKAASLGVNMVIVIPEQYYKDISLSYPESIEVVSKSNY